MPCVSAHPRLQDWIPGLASPHPVVVVIGKARCTADAQCFQFAAIVIKDDVIVVHGGLGTQQDINLFLNKLRGRLNGDDLKEWQDPTWIVPCPPPNLTCRTGMQHLITALKNHPAGNQLDLASLL